MVLFESSWVGSGLVWSGTETTVVLEIFLERRNSQDYLLYIRSGLNRVRSRYRTGPWSIPFTLFDLDSTYSIQKYVYAGSTAVYLNIR